VSVAVAAAGAVSGTQRRKAVGAAVGFGLIEHEVAALGQRLVREIRGAAYASTFGLGMRYPVFFAEYAVDPDFVRLLVEEVRAGATTVVEFGSGLSSLLIAAELERRGSGRLYSIEADASWASRTQEMLADHDLDHRVEIVVAPLTDQLIDGRACVWHEVMRIPDLAPASIDLLVVDGPPSLDEWRRWPALPVLFEMLKTGARIYLDDGRRNTERAVAQRWLAAHRDLELFWIDTTKGTWKLVKGSPSPGGSPRLLRTISRIVNPRPAGFGLAAVRRG
jgi:predicted O-methyltransferase YrrM